MSSPFPERNPIKTDSAKSLAVVVIGRNEGDRLLRCIDSISSHAELVVYVDSGSSDNSVEAAGERGAVVVSLDSSQPFTAARARNVGFRHVRKAAPHIQFVQFVDGDCEVAGQWLSEGIRFLERHPEVGAATGRRRELFPSRSVYNWLCDVDWDRKPGEARECGGDVMVRVAAFEEGGGYRDDLIAGEEPEMCVRLRAKGWKIWRLTAEMTVHDANMTKFSQWWRRSTRTGFAFAEGAYLHGSLPERHWVRESRSVWVWGAGIPILLAIFAEEIGAEAFWLSLIYLVQIWRVARHSKGTPKQQLIQGWFVVLGKFPQALGQFRFLLSRLSGRGAELIEYK